MLFICHGCRQPYLAEAVFPLPCSQLRVNVSAATVELGNIGVQMPVESILAIRVSICPMNDNPGVHHASGDCRSSHDVEQ
jgi:hypothetical protein